MNRTWIIFFLRVLHPLSWLRKLTLQWCMQEGQVAVVIIAAKSSQNLPLNGVTVIGESQGWHSLRQALGTADSGYSRMGVLGEHSLELPWALVSRWDCTQAGCLQEQGSALSLSPHRHPWKALSCSFLMGCAGLAGLE